MSTPSWPELAGRNAAAAMISFSGRLTSTSPDGLDVLDFWHAGGGRWRIERDGEVQYLSDGETVYYRGRDGRMVQAVKGRRFGMVWVTNGFGPTDLIGPDGMLHKMSREVGALTDPVETTLDGRESWTVGLGRPGAEPDAQLTVVIDAQTGVVVGLASAHEASVAVAGLSSGALDDELFVWKTGSEPVPQPDPEQTRVVLAERLEILSAVETGLDRRAEVLAVVEASETVDDARTAVADLLGVGRTGADAVLAQQVRRFTAAERAAVRDEAADLRMRLTRSD
ncbi:hypothetical protein L5I01_13995 [Gordonia sp. HY442]|uniref:hypothetical protein n=1 Tax=Gordonia zhenghanii TaxID=2911516 RepID=UPI001F3888C8|nr:hypothetical protein [Gordonia zhenghanii]MCF8604466.1 hypothetical protein [Gordonia zhenghanii]